MGMTGKWHFTDYPKSEDTCLLVMCDGEFITAEYDVEHHRWLDVGRDREWFTGGVACWVYCCDLDVPETRKEMPPERYTR